MAVIVVYSRTVSVVCPGAMRVVGPEEASVIGSGVVLEEDENAREETGSIALKIE